MRLVPDRDIALFWDVPNADEFHDLDVLQTWSHTNPRFAVMLTATRVGEGFTHPEGLLFVMGPIREVLEQPCEIEPRGRDVYLAGPRRFNFAVLEALDRCGISRERVVVETIGD